MGLGSIKDHKASKSTPLFGVGLAMFLIFAGLSSSQFHSYLFESNGLRDLQIGILLMAGQAAAIFSPLVQVPIIRKFGGPRLPLMFMIAGASVTLSLLPYMHHFWSFLILFPAFSFCAASVFPLNAASTLEAMQNQEHGAFFRIRSFGTLGFLVGCLISLCFPVLSDLPFLYRGFSVSLILALGVVYWDFRRGVRNVKLSKKSDSNFLPSAPHFRETFRLLREPDTLRLLILLGLMNFANALAIGVQGNYLLNRWEQGQRSISMAWVISTACEVPIMLLCALLLKRKGLRVVIGLGIFGTLIKLTGLAAAGSLWQYYLALTMHGCFFAGALTGFNIYLDRRYQQQERATLQTISGIFYGGIPSALAGLSSGWIWHVFSLRSVYLVSGAIAFPAAFYAFFLLNSKGKISDPYVL